MKEESSSKNDDSVIYSSPMSNIVEIELSSTNNDVVIESSSTNNNAKVVILYLQAMNSQI